MGVNVFKLRKSLLELKVNNVSPKIFREQIQHLICKPGYRLYLKTFGFKTYGLNSFLIKLFVLRLFNKEFNKKLQRISLTNVF